MSDRPAPLTPINCDLRDFPYLPLDVVRLRDSDMAAVDEAEAFRAAVLLWCASWHQVPAASLPENDAALCRLAGYGRDLKTWKRAKEAGALRGWILCSDGRLYHPVVAEKANDAMLAKAKQREKTRAAREARDAKRKEQPSHTIHQASDTFSVTENGTEHVTDDDTHSDTTSVSNAHAPLSHRPSEGKGREVKGREGILGVERTSGGPAHARTHDARRVGPMPTANDPPAAWFGIADKTEVDDRDGIEKPVVGGWYVDGVAQRVCLEARISFTRAVDWVPLFGWLREGFSPEEHIYPAIRRLAARPGYQPPRFLTYFDQAVREARAA